MADQQAGGVEGGEQSSAVQKRKREESRAVQCRAVPQSWITKTKEVSDYSKI